MVVAILRMHLHVPPLDEELCIKIEGSCSNFNANILISNTLDNSYRPNIYM